MSYPIRYSAAGTKIVETDPAGPLVEYIDYAILKAEFDEYRKAATIAADSVIDERNRLKAEVERLRASSFVTAVPVEQYERLRKAGDLLAFHYISLGRKFFPDDPLPSSVTEWNAAKDGKPSA